MLTVCIDANVYISAFAFNGLPGKVIELALERKFNLITSFHILREVKKNLVGKLDAVESEVDEFLDDIISIATLYEPDGKIAYIGHEKDNLVLETAIRGCAHVLVTGDKKDLLPLQVFKGVIIEPPSAFLERLKKMSTNGSASK